jgi:hypothetical protein
LAVRLMLKARSGSAFFISSLGPARTSWQNRKLTDRRPASTTRGFRFGFRLKKPVDDCGPRRLDCVASSRHNCKSGAVVVRSRLGRNGPAQSLHVDGIAIQLIGRALRSNEKAPARGR